MSQVAGEALVIVVLILANGVFSMSEIAVVSARRARLQQLADDGDRGARTALELAAAPNRFLATIQIGITLIGILAGAFGGATLAGQLASRLAGVSKVGAHAQAIAVTVVVLAITFLTLVVGELAPKRVGLANAERIAARMAPLLDALSRLAAPAVALVGGTTSAVLRLLPVASHADRAVTEEEIRIMIGEGAREGVFEPGEEAMIDGVFRLHDRTVETLMTPRHEVVWLDVSEPADAAAAKMAASGHSHVPVARGDLDDVVGVLAAKDLLAHPWCGGSVDIATLLRPALFVPETLTAAALLERFRVARDHVAIVIDEFGGCEGVVTGEDVFAAIVGELPTRFDEDEPRAEVRADGSWLVDGRLSVDRLQEVAGVQDLPQREVDDYRTVAGLVLSIAGRLPVVGERFVRSGWSYEVVDMDGRRVDKVIVSPVDTGTGEGEADRI